MDLVNLRLDHVKAYNSERHYQDLVYRAKRWVKSWNKLLCDEKAEMMITKFLIERRKVSPHTGNIELRSLRALFNFGVSRKIIKTNPTDGIAFFPIEKKVKYVPDNEDINKVIAVADPDTQDYIETLRETMVRVNETNQLLWEDVYLLIMKTLCAKAGVKYFRFHPIRYCGASIMDGNNVPIGAIKKIWAMRIAKPQRFICIA